MDEEEEILKLSDRATIRRLHSQMKSYLYSEYVDDPEIVRVIDRYLLEDYGWHMILIDQATYEDISDMSSESILYEVVKNATVRHIDPDKITEVITTVMKLGSTGNNVVSIYYK